MSKESKEVLRLKERWDEQLLLLQGKQILLDTVTGRVEGLAAQLVDAPTVERAALLDQWGALTVEQTALQAEVRILTERRDVACLAYYELIVIQAEEERRRLDNLARKAGQSVNAIIEERLRFWNRGRGDVSHNEGFKTLGEIESRLALAQARARIATRNVQLAGRAYEAALTELRHVQEELELEQG